MADNSPTTREIWRPRPDRRRLIFWWPAAAILVIMTLLWGVAGSQASRHRAPPVPRLPEPGAAYVLVGADAQALYLKADIIARPAGLGFGRTGGASLEAGEAAPDRVLAPLILLPGSPPAPWRPVHLDTPARLPILSERALTPAGSDPPPAPNALSLQVSGALERAGFTSAVTRANLPATAGRMRVWVELDHTGQIVHALAESPGDWPREALRAMRTDGGTNAAIGWVDLAWPAGSGK
ncbi:MAG: hypothetical protein FJ222_10715 [Lentisphaerae bacterium]|nr:hypothetical protein [Lentisphaerota bacterium]